VKWIRTWPERIPPFRGYVVDMMERAVMDTDYFPVLAALDTDTVIIEWDLAVSLEDMLAFTAACEADPGTVRVAPYRLYHRQAHRRRRAGLRLVRPRPRLPAARRGAEVPRQ
jgi:hypothetical protein